MSKEQTMEQLRNIIREVIREEITQRNLKHDEKSGVTKSDLVDPKTGETIGTSAHTTTPEGGVKSFRGHIFPKSKRPTSESYTLEEWMGMLEEAGYDLEETSLSRMVWARDTRLNRAAAAGEEADKIEKTPGFKVRDRLIKKADDAREEERFNRARAERTAQHIRSRLNT